MTWVSEALDAVDRATLAMEYGEGRWECALCGQVRPMAELTAWNYRGDSFMLCDSPDVIPTCFERYRAGRKAWNATHG